MESQTAYLIMAAALEEKCEEASTERRIQFGNRLLVDPAQVYKHNAWYAVIMAFSNEGPLSHNAT